VDVPCSFTGIGIVPSVSELVENLKQMLTPATLQAPEIVGLYALNVSPTLVRQRIRERFERNRHVTDPRVIDVLILKGQQEFQETMNCWKLSDHIYGIMLQPQTRPQKTFMQKFLEGSLGFSFNISCHLTYHFSRTR
jgi:hypothetical protein